MRTAATARISRPAPAEQVLVVEDDGALRRLLSDEMKDAGFDVQAVPSAEEAEKHLAASTPDLVLSDLRLPGANGLELLRFARTNPDPPAFVVITAFGTVSQAVEALKSGADDFLTKPLDLDHLLISVSRVLERRRLTREVRHFRDILQGSDFYGMVGRSGAMRRMFDQIRRVARGSGSVLILGESGSGKELVARAIHQESQRAEMPFLAVNCAGIPEPLLESEFFGHAAGSFTGAGASRKGLFAQAAGGSLLLDEISEMPLPLQAKLLRALQDGQIRPVGRDQERSVDVRILAATHRDLARKVRDGEFREDLFYRLDTFTLAVPPLREREEDGELLAGRFVSRFAAQLEKEIGGIEPDALEKLRAYPYPGNVRELQSIIERAVTFCDGKTLRLEHLPLRLSKRREDAGPSGPVSIPPGIPMTDGVLPSLAEVEIHYIRHVLERVKGNKRRAAALLGIGRRTLYRRLEEIGVPGDDPDPNDV